MSQSVRLMSVVLARQNSMKDHTRSLCTKKDAPAELHRTWRQMSTISKNTDKATFYSPIEARARLAPTSKRPEDREFAVDSGASVHMLSKKDLSPEAPETLRSSRTPTTMVTANGEVQTNEEAQVHIHDLDLFVTVQLLEETLAVLSLGKFCEDHGYFL